MKELGTLEHDGKGQWLVTAQAHILIRMKRVFAQISNHQHGTLRISDNKENARDLEWFLQRYPLTICGADLAYLEKQAAEHREGLSLVDKILAGSYEPRAFDLAVPLRNYQQIGADLWLKRCNLLLGDELGLGKTSTAIGGLSTGDPLPAIVVTKTNLKRQWRDEFVKFAPNLKTHIIQSTKPYDVTKGFGSALATKFTTTGLPDVLIMSYMMLAYWVDTLVQSKVFRSIVFDEVQELRNGTDTGKGKSAKALADVCKYRIGLSASPVYNMGGEIWEIMEVLNPGALGTKEEFNRHHATAVGQGKYKLKDPKAFGQYIRDEGMFLRRTRAEVGQEIPDLTQIVHHVDHDSKVIDGVKDLMEILASQYIESQDRQVRFQAGGRIDAVLRQATGIAKAPAVAAFVEILLEQGERVVLFGHHHAVYEIWQDKLRDYHPAMYTGLQSENQKEQSKARFVSGETNLLIVALRSSEGIDGLQFTCSITVHGELDWTPKVHYQATGRVHRPGQRNPCLAYYMLSTGGTDPLMADVLNIKEAQSSGITDPDKEIAEAFNSAGISHDHLRAIAERYLNRSRPPSFIPPKVEIRSDDFSQQRLPITAVETIVEDNEEERGIVLLGVDISWKGLGLVAVPIDWNGDWAYVETCKIEGDLKNSKTDNERANLATNIAGAVVDFALEHGCTEAYIERIPTHNAFGAVMLGGMDMVVRTELRREGIDLYTSHMATARKLMLGKNPTSRTEGTEGKKIDVKRQFILPAFVEFGCPFIEPWQADVRDAHVSVQLGLKKHRGFVYSLVAKAA